jgi:hypothetical protein
MEFVGLARQLRTKVAEAHARYETAAEALITPFRPRPGFTPMPRRAMLERLLRRYRAQRSLSRLRLISKFEDGKFQIIELRAEPSRMTLPGWEDAELAVTVSLHALVIRPPAFSQLTLPLACVGLHALARRFQRGADRTDRTVLCDIEALGRGWRTAVQGTMEFEVPAPGGGRWIGAQHLLGEVPVLAVRTFIE